jgi:tRNA(fMet)-specific endonuclease VapC
MYCLDTNIWSYILRQPNKALIRNLSSKKTADLCLAELTRAELLYGALRSSQATHLRQRINELLSPYADIRMRLEKVGKSISPNDLIIAATARAAGATLVTANLREFSRVPGLKCRDWTAG